ncbi:MAG: hypothetical protein AAF456_23165 [Planctomycetota bacterium]
MKLIKFSLPALLLGLLFPIFAAQSVSAQAVADTAEAQDPRSQDEEATGDDESNEAIDPTGFIRISRNADGDMLAMQTSVTRYEYMNDNGDMVYVDLIGVVHIGEQEYYEQLNGIFEKYDAMLYELVAPEGTIIPRGGRTEGVTNPIAALQLGMKQSLELEFQLEHIDYTRGNFVHADMSPEEFAESMARNDESFGKMFLRAIGSSMALQSRNQNSGLEYKMLRSMISGDSSSMRQAMAQQMQDIESGMIMFEGKDGSTIIDHRNAKCMDILSRELDEGHTKLAIFYGAGHLPDMEERLINDFNMKRGGRFWLDAWDLQPEE